jgi:ferredoxin
MPHPSKYQLKGCIIGKKKDLESIFTEIPIEDEFEEQGERAGAALNAQVAEQQAEQSKPDIAANSNGCNGCNGCAPKSSSGCLGYLLNK